MNVNISLGILSFIVWSAFSTWYYVNFIKNFDDSSITTEVLDIPAEEPPYEIQSTSDSVNTKHKPDEQKGALPENPKISLNKDVFFVKNASKLIAPDAFDSFYDSLQKAANGQNVLVNITGYACDLGTETYNKSLSKARAEVMANLIKDGPMEVSSINYKGESDPLVPNTTESNRAKNRRVNLQFTTK